MCECPTMYTEDVVTARKAHRCCECGVTITKGEQYQSVSGMWDGQFDRIKTCMPCVEIRRKLTVDIPSGDCCELPAFGELRQYLLDGEYAELYAAAHARFVNAQQHSEQQSNG